jgi:GTP diphosphokinase / guanosine-3',5'-bis(diphosphate) 3'-diphosphatase
MNNLTKDELALVFAFRAHQGQFRKFSKHPYIVHPIRVCNLLREYYPEFYKCEDVKASAYLHDVIEDTNTSVEQLKDLFGEKVSKIVFELTTDEKECKKMGGEADPSGKGEYLRLKLIGMSKEARAIKLCDRLDNLTDLESHGNIPLTKINETLTMLSAFLTIKATNEDKVILEKFKGILYSRVSLV